MCLKLAALAYRTRLVFASRCYSTWLCCLEPGCRKGLSCAFEFVSRSNLTLLISPLLACFRPNFEDLELLSLAMMVETLSHRICKKHVKKQGSKQYTIHIYIYIISLYTQPVKGSVYVVNPFVSHETVRWYSKWSSLKMTRSDGWQKLTFGTCHQFPPTPMVRRMQTVQSGITMPCIRETSFGLL